MHACACTLHTLQSVHWCSRLHLFPPFIREAGSSATRLYTLALAHCMHCSVRVFLRWCLAGSSATRLYTLALAHCMHCSVRVFLRWCLAPRWGGRLERHSLAPSSPLFCPHGRARSQGPIWSIGLLPKAEYSLPSVLKHIEEPLRVSRTAGDAMHQDTAIAAAACLRGAFQHASLRIQTAFRGKTESSTSFVDGSLRARTTFDEKLSRLHDVARLLRDFKQTVTSLSPAKPSGDKGTPKLRNGKRRVDLVSEDADEEPGSRHGHIVERGGGGDFFGFSAVGSAYSRKAIQAGLLMLETSWKGLSICRMHSLKGY